MTKRFMAKFRQLDTSMLQQEVMGVASEDAKSVQVGFKMELFETAS